MSGELKADGSYQGSHLETALSFVTDFTIAIDGGAHVGTWARPLAAKFGRVIAAEPSADTHEALTVNMAAFNCWNVEIHRMAFGASAGYVSMVLDGRAADLKNTGARYAAAGDDVKKVTIDSLELPTLGFLKLDVEGSEVFALQGAKETLKRCKPIVLFEDKYLWKRYGLPREAPQDVLRSVGYRELAKVSMDRIWGPK
jgi:FkbM family methyltransferase